MPGPDYGRGVVIIMRLLLLYYPLRQVLRLAVLADKCKYLKSGYTCLEKKHYQHASALVNKFE